jgi:hypothetical protein
VSGDGGDEGGGDVWDGAALGVDEDEWVEDRCDIPPAASPSVASDKGDASRAGDGDVDDGASASLILDSTAVPLVRLLWEVPRLLLVLVLVLLLLLLLLLELRWNMILLFFF